MENPLPYGRFPQKVLPRGKFSFFPSESFLGVLILIVFLNENFKEIIPKNGIFNYGISLRGKFPPFPSYKISSRQFSFIL